MDPPAITDLFLPAPNDLKMEVNGPDLNISFKTVTDATHYKIMLYVNDTLGNTSEKQNNKKYWLTRVDIVEFEEILMSVSETAAVYHLRCEVFSVAGSDTSSPAKVEIDYVKRTKIVGSYAGSFFDDIFGNNFGVKAHSPSIIGIQKLYIRCGDHIDAVETEYIQEGGNAYDPGKHGGDGGNETAIQLEKDEFFNKVEVITDRRVVNQLTFHTTKGSKYGPYGKKPTSRYEKVDIEGKMIALCGRVNSAVSAIGFYCYLLE